MKSSKTGFAACWFASFCLLALTSIASAQSNWTTQMILNSTSIQAYGVNNNNVVTGDAGASFNTEQGYFWDNVNQLRIWPIFAAASKSWYSNGRGINHLSPPVACGDARDTTSPTFNRAMAAICPANGVPVSTSNLLLLSLGGGVADPSGQSLATAINNNKDIVGEATYPTNHPQATLWRSTGATTWGNPIRLGLGDGRDSRAMDVEEREADGVTALAVGWVIQPTSLRNAFFFNIDKAGDGATALSAFLPTSPSGYTWSEANGVNRQRDIAGMAKIGSGGARHVMVRRSTIGGFSSLAVALPIPAGWAEAYANDIGPRFTSSIDGHQKVWISGTLVAPSGTNEAFAEIVDITSLSAANGPIYTLTAASPGGFPNGSRYFGQAQGINERGSDGFLRGYLPTIVGVGANNGGSFTYAVVARSSVDNFIDSGSIAIGSVSVGGTSTTGGSTIRNCFVTLRYEGGNDPIFEHRTVSLTSSDPRVTFFSASGQPINSVQILGQAGGQNSGVYQSEEFWIGTAISGSAYASTISAGVGQVGYLPDPNGWPVITVNPTPTSLTAPTPTTVTIGQNIQFSSTLSWSGGPIQNGTVSFTTNNHTVNGTTNGSGVAIASGMAIDESFIPGTPYQLVASFNGSAPPNSYQSTSNSSTLTVQKANTSCTPNSGFSAPVRSNYNLTATLRRTTDNATLSGYPLTFSIDGLDIGSANTNGSGVATLNYTFPVNLGPGQHTLGARYLGGSQFYNASPTGSGQFTLTNIAPFAGLAGSAVQFNGTNGYIDVADDAWFGGDLTIECWVRVDAPTLWSRLLDFGNGPASNNIVLATSDGSTGRPYFATYIGAAGSPLSSPSVLPIGSWVQVAATLSGNTGCIYIDGALVATGTMQSPLAIVRTLNYIGRSNWAADAYLAGAVDDIRIYSRAKPQWEILRDRVAMLLGSLPGIKSFWQMNESAGAVMGDSGPSNLNGNLLGGTTWAQSGALMNAVYIPYRTPTAIPLEGFDPEGQPLTYSIVTQPLHGTFSGSGQVQTYTPSPGYYGPDSFTYKANDGFADSAPAQVYVMVNPPTTFEGYRINCGGNSIAPFTQDPFGTLQTDTVPNSIDTSAAFEAAPMQVYQTTEFSNSPYNFNLPGLRPNTLYKVRLHFSENHNDTARRFNVSVNGQPFLTNYSIWNAAGGQGFKAVVEERYFLTDANGGLQIAFTPLVSSFVVGGIEATLAGPVTPRSYTLEVGSVLSGALADLYSGDDWRLLLQDDPSGSPEKLAAVFTGYATKLTPSSMSFHLEQSADPTNSLVQLYAEFQMWDYSNSNWVSAGKRTLSVSDGSVDVAPPGPIANFIQPVTLQVKTRVLYRPHLLKGNNIWRVRLDQVVWNFGP